MKISKYNFKHETQPGDTTRLTFEIPEFTEKQIAENDDQLPCNMVDGLVFRIIQEFEPLTNLFYKENHEDMRMAVHGGIHTITKPHLFNNDNTPFTTIYDDSYVSLGKNTLMRTELEYLWEWKTNESKERYPVLHVTLGMVAIQRNESHPYITKAKNQGKLFELYWKKLAQFRKKLHFIYEDGSPTWEEKVKLTKKNNVKCRPNRSNLQDGVQ